MSKKCCIPNCRLQNDDPGCLKLNFFQILSNENIQSEWCSNINKYFKKEIVFKKYSYVCALHFEPTCFNYGGLCKVLRLKKSSCPTIFENYSSEEVQVQPTNICNDDLLGENQKDISANTTVIRATSENSLARICETIDHTTNTNAKSQNCTLQNNSNPIDDVAMEKISEMIEFEDSHSGSSDNLTNHEEASQINEMNRSSMDYSEIGPQKNLFNKSLTNINLESIDYEDKDMVRRILEIAQKEVISLRRYRRVQAMRLYRAKKKINNSSSLIFHVKQRNLISNKVSEILKVSSTEC